MAPSPPTAPDKNATPAANSRVAVAAPPRRPLWLAISIAAWVAWMGYLALLAFGVLAADVM